MPDATRSALSLLGMLLPEPTQAVYRGARAALRLGQHLLCRELCEAGQALGDTAAAKDFAVLLQVGGRVPTELQNSLIRKGILHCTSAFCFLC
jgi:hypothetical protein